MKYIKKYKLFEELRKIVSDSSSTGRTKSIDWVYNDDTDNPKSSGSGVLLRQDLKDREFQDLVNIFGKDTPPYVIKNLINGSRNSKRMSKFIVTMNNLQFLKDKQKELGELYCEYCNKGPLVIYDINPLDVTPENINNPNYRFNSKFSAVDGATADHKTAQSRGGNKLDYSNLAVCCSSCNKSKGNMSYEDWMYKLSKNESMSSFDLATSANIGDILSESHIYDYAQRLHRNEEDFIDGDISERIGEYSKYKLELVNISDINIDEWEIDEDKVLEYEEEYKNRQDYPPIVIGDKDNISCMVYKNGKYVYQHTIIDGTHRVNALYNLGIDKVKAWVGI